MATNPAMFSWQQPLAALFGGLSAAGQPGGFANFGAGVNQTMQQQQQQQMEQERFGMLREQADRQRQEWEAQQRRANQAAEQQAASQRQWAAMLGGAGAGGVGSIGTANAPSAPQAGQPAMFAGGQMPVTPHGGYGAATGGVPQPAMFSGAGKRPDGSPVSFSDVQNGGMASPTQQGADGGGADLPFGFTPEQAQLFQTLPYAQQAQIMTERGFAQPESASSGVGKIMEDFNRGLIDAPTRDALLRKETYITPPAQGAETWSQVTINGRPMLQSSRGDIKEMPGEGGGPFEGNAMDAQASNILLTGDPASPEYAAAYAWLAQPKVSFDATTGKSVIVSPDLGWASQPTNPSAAMPAPTAPNQMGGNAGALPFMPSVTGNRVGPTVQNAQGFPQQPAPSAPGTETMRVPGATITTNPGTGLSAADRSKLRDIRANAESIRGALTRFRDVVKETGIIDRTSAATGGLTEGGRKLNSAWTNAAIMSKAEALFHLGVLNGPDLEVIQGTLPNPSTAAGAVASDDAYNVAIDEVLRLIDGKVAAYERQFSGTGDPAAPTQTLPGGGTRVDQLPAGNWQ
jgi:hypothetical protein